MPARFPAAALASLIVLAGCDRGMAPFDPDEGPAPPDLAKIFPDQAASRLAAPSETIAAAASTRDQVVRGEIRLLPELAARLPGDALLFIIARTPGGGPPLAVKRVENPELPFRFELGPEDRMIAARPFAGPFSLSAWIDKDGNVTTRGAGDLEGDAEGTFGPGDGGIEIIIDRTL